MKIAIIDDSVFMRRLVRAAFAQASPGAEITEFAEAETALAELPALAPDLITVDMLMPKLHGLEFLARLRQQARQPRVIVVTADIQKSIRERCAELGVTEFIEKPITFDKLHATLTRLLAA
ncbi:MAG TPA: response regulator [Methylomirabilota bacterium]|nr:response regulator [Methylomirabilota bacterium]